MNVNWNFGAIIDTLNTEASRTKGLSLDAIEELGKKILDTAKKDCPEKTGALKKSGRMRVRKGKEAQTETVTITFGNKRAPYAVPVHYDPNLKFKTGKTRFLESAVDEHAGKGKLEQVVSRKYRNR